MDVRKFKPDKIEIYDCLLFDIEDSKFRLNESNENSETYNYISFSKQLSGSIEKDISPNTSSFSSSNSYENYQALDSLSTNLIVNDDISKHISKAKMKIEKFKKKEEMLFYKFQLEEKAKLRIIGESKCHRFVKYDCKIGEGGYKLVYRGFDRTTCRDIAWCEIKREHISNKDKRQSMLKEIEIMLKLNHPNVVKCFDVLKTWWTIHDDIESSRTDVKGLVIVQELMNEGTLKGMIRKNFQDGLCILDIFLITKWWYQILDVLRYMHCRMQPPIIHRDLKSENCFLVAQPNDECLSVKIGDFGLATTINHNSKRNTMIGTVGFMAPEVYEEKYDTKVDIYAFGILMLEVMTNKTPYDECTNVFQVVSKSMGKHLPDVISNLEHPLIKEIIMSCVHPIPCYRPTAEELCEHPLFQVSTVIVEPCIDDLNKDRSIMKLMDNLSKGEIIPIIDLRIVVKSEFLNNHFENPQFSAVIISFDIYKTYNTDLSKLELDLKTCFEKKIKNSPKKLSQLEKLLNSILSQIQYLTKTIIGERWRRIFDLFLNKENQSPILEQNLENMPAEDKLINTNPSIENQRSTNNFEEYNFNVSIYHKATKFLTSEIENYCRESELKGLPYFSRISQTSKSYKNNLSTSSDLSNIDAIKFSQKKTSVSKLNFEEIKVSPIKRTRNASEKSIRKLSNSELDLKVNSNKIGSDKYQTTKEMINEGNHLALSENCIKYTQPSDNYVNIVPNFQNFIHTTNYDSIHYRHFSEPAFINASSSSCPMTSIYPLGPNFNSGSIPSHSEINSYQYTNNHTVKFNQDQNHSVGYVGNFNSPPVLGPNSNLLFQQQQQQFINYIQSNFHPSQHRLIVSPQNTIPGQNLSSIYSGLYYPPAALINNLNPNFMHNNIQYANPMDPTIRHQTAEPILTRSLPSIIGNPTASCENVMSPTVIQTSVSSALPSRAPLINNVSGLNEMNASQRPILVPSSSIQKLNPTLMSTPRPVINRNQAAISPIPTSKVQEKSKPKKPKTRLKSKYLLRISEITEIPSTKEIKLDFQMMLPMNQMKFSFTLNNELNLSKCLGDPGQFPGELRKKEILESLITTLKKMCDCLLDDSTSIPLNEDFVFHPCFPNSGLVKFSDCTYQMQISSEIYEPAQSSSGLLNQYNYLNTIPSNLVGNPLIASSASSRSLSRHASTEDLSWNINNPFPVSDQSWLPIDPDYINTVQPDGSQMPQLIDALRKPSKSVTDVDNSRNIKITTKCTCNPPSKDCCIRIPEFLFPSIRQVIDKLQNPHTKGLIILPQSNEILLRNLRILEIPPDHMFFGLPCSDSSFNVVKGHKDNDFIIAKDTRQSESVSHSKKCVYQIPNDGAVLLDSTGAIQHLQHPSLVIPSSAQSKAQIKELPFELTHNKIQLLDCNQILSVLKSLSMIPNSADLTKDETFDSPVMLEPVMNSHSTVVDKIEICDSSLQQRRGSGDNTVPAQQNPSQVQVECVSFQYVPLSKSTGSKLELEGGLEIIDRDLPRQQVRNRKISNESLEAISTRRGPMYMNEEHLTQQSQSILQKMVVNNPIGMQNVRAVQVGTILNQMPVQRLPNSANPVGHSGQFVLSSQTSVNQIPQNILMHNIPGVPQYGIPTSGTTPVSVAMSQSNNTVPVVLSNQNPIGINFTPIVPNQVVLPSGMMANQMPQMHIQQQSQLTNQRMATPMSMSSQHLANMPGHQIPNMMSGSIMSGNYSNSIHNSIPTATSEQHFVTSHPTEFINIKDQVRQMSQIRQLPVGNNPYFDPNMNSSMIPDHIRMRMNQPISNQSQSQPPPIRMFTYPNITTAPNSIPTGVNTPKLGLSDQSQIQQSLQQPQISSIQVSSESIAINNQVSESDKIKTEQTIGRFVIRPVAENTEKT